ncbi:MAG: DUF2322 family protein [Pasteurellaceae bacterium]|nr:DUF2322 family protein [Pasteurellaceae bacterium]
MQFKDYLATFACVDHVMKLEIVNEDEEIIHIIPAIEGKLGSLKLYYTLAERFTRLTPEAAQQGLIWFAEHVVDAKQNPGKHPNIDLLFKVIDEQRVFKLRPIVKET